MSGIFKQKLWKIISNTTTVNENSLVAPIAKSKDVQDF